MKQAAFAREAILSQLPNGIITVGTDHTIRYANAAAEHFLGESMTVLAGRAITQFILPAAHLKQLLDAAYAEKTLIKEYDTALHIPRGGQRIVNLQIMPLDETQELLIVIDDRGVNHHMPLRETARLASGMASILAHEVKNPLSGIRGAAQLLGKSVYIDDRKLTNLIVSEVDRIKGVIEEMEIFSNPSELKTESLNIHEVLQYVRLLAEQGFARSIAFREVYDPSLPEVAGHRNLLIQMLLNLIKNAAEALEGVKNPVITLSTHFQSGFHFTPAGSTQRRALPIVVSVEDNGTGIAADMRESVFGPFVTTKEGGKGLGLAVVAKIAADHGGTVLLDESVAQGTRFRIFLPGA